MGGRGEKIQKTPKNPEGVFLRTHRKAENSACPVGFFPQPLTPGYVLRMTRGSGTSRRWPSAWPQREPPEDVLLF